MNILDASLLCALLAVAYSEGNFSFIISHIQIISLGFYVHMKNRQAKANKILQLKKYTWKTIPEISGCN